MARPKLAPWKQAVAAVGSTVADAAVDAVTIVGDAARSLASRDGAARRPSRTVARRDQVVRDRRELASGRDSGLPPPAKGPGGRGRQAPGRSPADDGDDGVPSLPPPFVRPVGSRTAAAGTTDGARTAETPATTGDTPLDNGTRPGPAAAEEPRDGAEHRAAGADTAGSVADADDADVHANDDRAATTAGTDATGATGAQVAGTPADATPAGAAATGEADTHEADPAGSAGVDDDDPAVADGHATADDPDGPADTDSAAAPGAIQTPDGDTSEQASDRVAGNGAASAGDGASPGPVGRHGLQPGRNGSTPAGGNGRAPAALLDAEDEDDAERAPVAAVTSVAGRATRAFRRVPRRSLVPAWMPPLRRRREREWPWLVRAAVFSLASLAGLAAIVVAAVALLPRAVAFASESADAELILPDDTAFDPLAQRTRILYANGSLLAILHGEEDRKPVRVESMPDHAWQAIVAAEDKKFFDHEGYDPAGIGRAFFANFRAGGVEQGGSTISQQVARLNFKEIGLDQSVERKLKEIAYAIALEERFTKEEILDRYVNQVYFGSGAYGLQAASEEFFRADVSKIRVDQAALLAGLISSPSAYNPRFNPDLAREQRDLVLDSMSEAGFVTEQHAEKLKTRPLKIQPPLRNTNRQPSIVEEVIGEIKANPVFGATVQEREDNLFTGGLRIRTTISPKLQKLAVETIESRYPSDNGQDGVTAAISTVDPRTGAIKAAASARRYNKQNFNVALRGRRQPGSSFKPFVMAEALRQGFSPSTTLDARSPMVFPQRWGPDWIVSNYGGASYGQIDMAAATKGSVNTYFAQLIQLVGVEKAVNMAEKLGISRVGVGEQGEYGPAIVLGGLRQGVTTVEMASAYGTFANNGVHIEPHLIAQVKQGNKVLYKREPQRTQALKPAVNAAALRMLKGPPSAGGTASYIAESVYPWPVAGKTGTTQLATDAWFVATTPVMSTAVWVGHKNGQVRMYGATGGGVAAPVWLDFMQQALSTRNVKDFPTVNEAEFVGKTVKVPDLVGRSAQDALNRLAKKKLIGRAQYQASAAPAGSVLWVSPSDSAQVGTTVYLGVSTGTPPPPPEPERSDTGGDGDSGGDGDGGGNSGGGNSGGGNDGGGNQGRGNGGGGGDD
ncbi:MAG TPA: transglycosylase domain-containing protein [Euzebyales bacterium]